MANADTVPDVVFGRNYSWHATRNINYLPIKNIISFYNKGFLFELKNSGCSTEERFSDVKEIWVVDCTIEVTSTKENAPSKALEQFSRTFKTTKPFSGEVSGGSNSPFIFISFPKLSIENYSTPFVSENVSLMKGSMTSYSYSTAWDIRIVTSYGVSTIKYSAQEIWDRKAKKMVIGPLTITASITNINCWDPYGHLPKYKSVGSGKERCNVNINLSFNQNNENLIPIKILKYAE